MKLSPFEKEVLSLLSVGYSQKEIAVKYNISKTNVNNFLSRTRKKTGAKSNIHLVIEAYKNKSI